MRRKRSKNPSHRKWRRIESWNPFPGAKKMGRVPQLEPNVRKCTQNQHRAENVDSTHVLIFRSATHAATSGRSWGLHFRPNMRPIPKAAHSKSPHERSPFEQGILCKETAPLTPTPPRETPESSGDTATLLHRDAALNLTLREIAHGFWRGSSEKHSARKAPLAGHRQQRPGPVSSLETRTCTKAPPHRNVGLPRKHLSGV